MSFCGDRRNYKLPRSRHYNKHCTCGAQLQDLKHPGSLAEVCDAWDIHCYDHTEKLYYLWGPTLPYVCIVHLRKFNHYSIIRMAATSSVKIVLVESRSYCMCSKFIIWWVIWFYTCMVALHSDMHCTYVRLLKCVTSPEARQPLLSTCSLVWKMYASSCLAQWGISTFSTFIVHV